MMETLNMGGDGFYVWTSYGIFAAVIIWQAVQPILRHRRILAEIREERLVDDQEKIS